jgi:hypothetical protein
MRSSSTSFASRGKRPRDPQKWGPDKTRFEREDWSNYFSLKQPFHLGQIEPIDKPNSNCYRDLSSVNMIPSTPKEKKKMESMANLKVQQRRRPVLSKTVHLSLSFLQSKTNYPVSAWAVTCGNTLRRRTESETSTT